MVVGTCLTGRVSQDAPMRRPALSHILLFALTASSVALADCPQQVSNGDFESGNMNGWTTSGTVQAISGEATNLKGKVAGIPRPEHGDVWAGSHARELSSWWFTRAPLLSNLGSCSTWAPVQLALLQLRLLPNLGS